MMHGAFLFSLRLAGKRLSGVTLISWPDFMYFSFARESDYQRALVADAAVWQAQAPCVDCNAVCHESCAVRDN